MVQPQMKSIFSSGQCLFKIKWQTKYRLLLEFGDVLHLYRLGYTAGNRKLWNGLDVGAFRDYYKVIFQHLSRGIEENYKNPVTVAGVRDLIRNRDHQITGLLNTQPPCSCREWKEKSSSAVSNSVYNFCASTRLLPDKRSTKYVCARTEIIFLSFCARKPTRLVNTHVTV
jgi:hypothetical protein